MRCHRERFVLPRKRRMRQDDRHIGKIDGDVIDINWIGVLESNTATAWHAGTDAGLTGVKQRGELGGGDDLIQRVGLAIVRIKTLRGRMKLEAAYAVFLDQAPGF